MRGQVGPSAKELKSVAEYEKFIASDETGVIGAFSYPVFVVVCNVIT